MKKRSLWVVFVMLVGIGLAGVARRAWPLRGFSDNSPLPRGVVTAPVISEKESRSRFRTTLRVAIEALSSAIQKQPIHLDDGNGRGTIRITAFTLTPVDESSIEVRDGTATFRSDKGYVMKGFPVTYAKIDLSDTVLRPGVDANWECRCNPKVRANVSALKVKSVFPDLAVRAALNWWYYKEVRHALASRGNIPLKSQVAEYWKQVSGPLDITRWIAPATGSLNLKPIQAYVVQPIIERQSSSIRIVLGVDFSSVLWLGSAASPRASTPPSLPPLQELSADDRADTRIRLPIVMPVSDLSQFWKPSDLPIRGSALRIQAIDFSEQDGVLHGRMQFAWRSEAASSPVVPRSINGYVRFQARPTCDAKRGRIEISDFSFTEKSSSMLIDMIGAQANSVLRAAFEEAAPAAVDVLFRQAEIAAREKLDRVMARALKGLAKDMDELEEEILLVNPSISRIEFKPTDLRLVNGHIILILQADATISVTLDNAEPKPTPATGGSVSQAP